MNTLFLIKYGEISIKGDNKQYFFSRLKKNLKASFQGMSANIKFLPGRYYIQVPEEYADKAADILSHTFGITWYSKAVKTDKNIDAVEEAAINIVSRLIEKRKGTRFKIDVRRTDKSFPLDSYGIACRLGDVLRQKFSELVVNLTRPDWILHVEIREYAYLFGEPEKGPGGLPVMCAGKGILLLSGGIDSPVAGYMMAKRGLYLDAVYFHTPPYTSEDAKDKVIALARILGSCVCGMRLFIVPFTDVQVHIKKNAPLDEGTLHLRAAMMKCAEIIAMTRGAESIITGESLSQVASQTQKSIRFTGSYTQLPVFRPLIGFDKIEIIDLARKIGTYETSILPYPDCCTLFAPPHPLIRPEYDTVRNSFDALDLVPMIEDAAVKAEKIQVG